MKKKQGRDDNYRRAKLAEYDRLRTSGMNYRDAAKKIGHSVGAISKWRKAFGTKPEVVFHQADDQPSTTKVVNVRKSKSTGQVKVLVIQCSIDDAKQLIEGM